MAVTREIALKDPQSYVFRPMQGYFKVKRLGIEGEGWPGGKALPPKNCKDGSGHWLKPPGDAPAVAFTWHDASGSWINVHAARIGFTADYLTHYGWTYQGPQDPSLIDKVKAALNA